MKIEELDALVELREEELHGYGSFDAAPEFLLKELEILWQAWSIAMLNNECDI